MLSVSVLPVSTVKASVDSVEIEYVESLPPVDVVSVGSDCMDVLLPHSRLLVPPINVVEKCVENS